MQLELLACANPKDLEGAAPRYGRVDTLAAAAERVLGWGCRTVVATRGAEGASVFTMSADATELIEVVEPAVYLKVVVDM
jgi:sugar/nucleoside kinase (ribokinase family)